MGRIKLLVPSVLASQNTGWALPCFPFGGNDQQGSFSVPEIDATVWVEFEEGNISKPIWTGTFYALDDEAPEAAFTDIQPNSHVIQTRSGHKIVLNDDESNQSVTISHGESASIELSQNGSVIVKDKSDNQLSLDAENNAIKLEDSQGNTILMDQGKIEIKHNDGCIVELGNGGIKVKAKTQVTIEGGLVNLGGAGGEPIVKGLSFLSEFSAHTHVSSPSGGPTSPPMVPLTPASPGILSTKVFSN
jgi:uncharacterized protein involved in type VI secretion and phage assembly